MINDYQEVWLLCSYSDILCFSVLSYLYVVFEKKKIFIHIACLIKSILMTPLTFLTTSIHLSLHTTQSHLKLWKVSHSLVYNTCIELNHSNFQFLFQFIKESSAVYDLKNYASIKLKISSRKITIYRFHSYDSLSRSSLKNVAK